MSGVHRGPTPVPFEWHPYHHDHHQQLQSLLNHLGLWDVKRKPPPCANGPPTEAIIIYDESSAPSADDYIIDVDRTTLRLSTGYPIKTYL